jgi:hypothetical protein
MPFFNILDHFPAVDQVDLAKRLARWRAWRFSSAPAYSRRTQTGTYRAVVMDIKGARAGKGRHLRDRREHQAELWS